MSANFEQTAKLPSPVFRSTGHIYRIDSCRPQMEAIRKEKIDFHALSAGHYPGSRLPRGALPGLASIGFWDAVGPQDWGLNLHRNEGIEIALMETGGMPFTLEERVNKLSAGQMTLTRPWQLHAHGHPHINPGRLHWAILDVGIRRPNDLWKWPHWIILSQADKTELADRLRRNTRAILPASADVQSAFKSIARALVELSPKACISSLAVHFNALLLHLLALLRREPRTYDSKINPIEQTVALFLNDLENNLRSLAEDWTLESMAAECGLKTTAFAKYCHRLKNVSPLRHLTRLRLNASATLLRSQPDLSITDIAFQTGFHSSQYFATQFLNQFGCSPSAYRKE